MEMNMVHHLSRGRSVINHDIIGVGGHRFFHCRPDIFSEFNEISEDLGRGCFYVRIVFPRDDEGVPEINRIDIQKRDVSVVFVHALGGSFPFYDFAEYAVGHRS